ncbi:MAG: Hsp20/alpha crystallin family protein [Phycisphaerae bacterium]
MAIDRFGSDEGVERWTRNVSEIMDEMLKRSFVQFRQEGAWKPPTNVYETPEAYFVCVELAGMIIDEIQVECIGSDRLIISGQRAQPRPNANCEELSIHVLEIDEGRFRREVELPEPLRVDDVQATYDKGYLWITLPRTRAE